MSELTQKGRLISIKTELEGDDDLLLTSFKGSEHISDLFEFQLEVISNKPDISPADIVGKPVTVTIHENPERHFYGFVNYLTQFESTQFKSNCYKIKMVPWLWFLTQNNNYRVFQNQTTEQIITDVFRETGFDDFDYRTLGTSKPREYCVQYNESDFNFISRLLEEDGIAYYFEHIDGKHTLHIVDDEVYFKKIINPDITYLNPDNTKTQIRHWQHSYEFRKGSWSTNDYNIEQPKKSKWHTKPTLGTVLDPKKPNNKTVFPNVSNYDHASYEPYYDFSGLEDLALKRIETEETSINKVEAMSNCCSFYAGGVFNLTNHVEKENGSYLITTVQHNAEENGYLPTSNKSSLYTNEFKCIPSSVRFRPGLVHPKPVMSGPQSAVVIDRTDPLNMDRIKVQFHWSGESEVKEGQTCWIPVMQPWASNKWGTSFVPHIDMEVVVNFYNGDVDRPLIMGAVYNGENKSPYSNKNQSGILTNTTNEFRFDDTAGSEEIFIHGKKDLNIDVKNNMTETVINNKNINVNMNYTIITSGSTDITTEGDSSEVVLGSSTRRTSGKVEEWNYVDKFTKTMGSTDSIYIGNKKSLFIGGQTNNTIGIKHSSFVGASITTNLSTDINATKGAKLQVCEAVAVHKSKIAKYNAENFLNLDSVCVDIKGSDTVAIYAGSKRIDISTSGIKIKGDVEIKGDVKIKGNVKATGTVKDKDFTG